MSPVVLFVRQRTLPSNEHVHRVVYARVQQVIRTNAVMYHSFTTLIKRFIVWRRSIIIVSFFYTDIRRERYLWSCTWPPRRWGVLCAGVTDWTKRYCRISAATGWAARLTTRPAVWWTGTLGKPPGDWANSSDASLRKPRCPTIVWRGHNTHT